MANWLKIYACSGIGDSQGESFDYWLDNINVFKQTQAVNGILADIDSNYLALVHFAKTDKDRIELLNGIDFNSVCLYYAQEYANDPEMLKKAGRVIGSMVKLGEFDYYSLDNAERDVHLDDMFMLADQAMQSGDEYEADPEFKQWWNNMIVSRSVVGLSDDEYARLEECIKSQVKSVKGVSGEAWEQEEWAQYFHKAGNYFLYTFFTLKQLKRLPVVFERKHLGQLEFYNYCKALYLETFGSEAKMKQVIRNNIIKEFGATPEQVCAKIASGKYKNLQGVGWLTEAAIASIKVIVEVILAVAPILVALIYGICDYCKTANANKYKAVTEQDVKNNVFGGEDMDGGDYSEDTISKYIPYAAAGLGLMLLLKKS